MKLSNVARVALLGCDTVEEASTLLRWAMTEHQTIEGAGPSSELVHIREQLKSAEKSIVALQHANDSLKLKHFETESQNSTLKHRIDEAVMGEKIPMNKSDVSVGMVKKLIKDDFYANAKPFKVADIAAYFGAPIEIARNRFFYLWHGSGSNDPWPFLRQNFKPKRDGKCFVYYPNNFKHETTARVVAMGTSTGYTMPVSVGVEE